jgi:hypothetical protein
LQNSCESSLLSDIRQVSTLLRECNSDAWLLVVCCVITVMTPNCALAHRPSAQELNQAVSTPADVQSDAFVGLLLQHMLLLLTSTSNASTVESAAAVSK